MTTHNRILHACENFRQKQSEVPIKIGEAVRDLQLSLEFIELKGT